MFVDFVPDSWLSSAVNHDRKLLLVTYLLVVVIFIVVIWVFWYQIYSDVQKTKAWEAVFGPKKSNFSGNQTQWSGSTQYGVRSDASGFGPYKNEPPSYTEDPGELGKLMVQSESAPLFAFKGTPWEDFEVKMIAAMTEAAASRYYIGSVADKISILRAYASQTSTPVPNYNPLPSSGYEVRDEALDAALGKSSYRSAMQDKLAEELLNAK